MAEEFAPRNLRARLAALNDRIAQARTQLESHGIIADQAEALTEFIDEQEAIRGSLDAEGTITEIQHSKAEAKMDALEEAVYSWIKSVEGKFLNPAPHKPPASF